MKRVKVDGTVDGRVFDNEIGIVVHTFGDEILVRFNRQDLNYIVDYLNRDDDGHRGYWAIPQHRCENLENVEVNLYGNMDK